MSLWLKNISGGALDNFSLNLHLENGTLADGGTVDILEFNEKIEILESDKLKKAIDIGDAIFTDTDGGSAYSISYSLEMLKSQGSFDGSEATWDDCRLDVHTTASYGNPPTWVKLTDDGSGTTNAKAVEFYAGTTNAEMSIPNNAAYNVSGSGNDGTLSFWFFIPNNAPNDITLVRRDTSWGVWTNAQNRLTLWVHNIAQVQSSGTFQRGQWNHLAITFTTWPNNQRTRLYLNGVLQATASGSTGVATSTNPIRINYTHDPMTIDNVSWWSEELVASEVVALFNDGAGTELVGNETNLVSYWALDETTGSVATDDGTLGNDADILGTESTAFDWVSGHVGAVPSSTGVPIRAFNAGEVMEVPFDGQIPHKYAEGTDVFLHLHGVPMEAGGVGDRARWGAEYVWFDVGSTVPSTSIVYATANHLDEDLVEGKHYIWAFPTIDGSGKQLSGAFTGRFFRDGNNAGDTYDGQVGFLFADIHIQSDSRGSRQEYVK